MTALRRLPGWVLAGAGGVAILALVGSVLLIVQSVSAACASAAPALVGSSGKATYYTIGANGGNCSFGPQTSDLYVALGPSEYAAAGACGSSYDVTGPKGTVRVKVVDQCPECAPGHLDLGIEAFKRIGNQVDGIIAITYRLVRDPALAGPVTLRVKEGSSPFWLAIRADNTGNALAKLELRTGSGGWQSLVRTDFNYWLAESGAGGGPFTVRLTDVTGRQVTVGGIALRPGTTQASGVSMYSGGAGAGAGAPAAGTGSAARSAAAAPTSASTNAASANAATSGADTADPAGAAPPAAPGTDGGATATDDVGSTATDGGTNAANAAQAAKAAPAPRCH